MWNLLLLVALASSVSQFQINAQSETGADAPEIREAIARALVAGGMRVVLGGKDQDCDRCARVHIVEKQGGQYQIQVEQDARHASSMVQLAGDTPLLDKARALAVQVRLLTRPATRADAPVAVERKPKNAPSPAMPSRSDTKASPARVTLTTEPVPLPALSRPAPVATGPQPLTAPTAIFSPPRPAVPSDPAPAKPVALSPSERSPVATKPAAPPPTGNAAKASPPSIAIPNASPGMSGEGRTWPYIPLAVGVAAGVSAVVCGVLARDRYDALANRNWSFAGAQSLKSQGEDLQVASFVLGGTAVVGSLVAWAGFSKKRTTIRPVALATADRAYLGLTGELP